MSMLQRSRILEVSGVRELTHDSSYDQTIRAVLGCARLVSQGYWNDIALVYADVIGHCDAVGLEVPWSVEDIFFDDFTREITDGEFQRVQGKETRTGVGASPKRGGYQVGKEPGGGEIGSSGGGRDSRVWIDLGHDSSEEQEVTERVESSSGSGGSGQGNDLSGGGITGRREVLPF